MNGQHKKPVARGVAAALVVLALAGATLGAWKMLGKSVAPEASAVSGQVDASRSRRSEDVVVGMEPGVVQRDRLPVSTHASDSPIAMLDRSTSTKDLDAELMRRAVAGDAEAMAAIVELSGRCAPLWPSRGDRYHPRHELAQLPAASPERAEKEAALQILTQYCDRPYAPGEAAERARQFSKQLEELAGQGNLAAMAATGFEGKDEVEIVSTMLESDDPWVVEAALHAFVGNTGQIARQLDEEVFPFELRAMPNQLEMGKIKEMAARWRACESGAACGPNQYHELYLCLQWGNCGLGLGVQAYIRDHELSKYQFELMQRYLAALDARFKGGN